MLIDPCDAETWTVFSQTTPAERRLLGVLAWCTSRVARRRSALVAVVAHVPTSVRRRST